jgi:hypothetical protein
MELSTSAYEIIGKNNDGTTRIKLTLSAIPSERWVLIFNSKSGFKIKKSSPAIIYSDTSESIKSKNIVQIVKDLIKVVDEEVVSDGQKETTMLSHIRAGNIAVHDGISYNSLQYQQYLSKINSNQIL